MEVYADSLSGYGDVLENLIYGDPCEGDEPVDVTHRVITSNIDGDSIESRIQKAQVVILLEDHTNQEIQHLNGRVIRQHKKLHDIVLFERSALPQYLPFSLRRNAHSWDLEGTSEQKAILKRWQTLIQLGSHDLPTYLALAICNRDDKEGEVLPEMVEMFKAFSPQDGEAQFESYQMLDLQGRVDFLKNMAKECLTELRAIEEKYTAFLGSEFFARNVSLTDNIQKEVKMHSRVWVIAGEAHGRHLGFPESNTKGVDHLYHSLEAEKVHYLTLKCFHPGSDPDDYSHSPELAHRVKAKYDAVEEELLLEFRNKLEKEVPPTDPIIIQWNKINCLLQELEEYWEADGTWAVCEPNTFSQVVLERMLTWE